MSENQTQKIIRSGSTIYLPDIQAVAKTPASKNINEAKPTSVFKEDTNSTGKIAYWGHDNLFPQTVIKECEKNPVVSRTLHDQALVLYGSGLLIGKIEDINPDGSEKFVPIKNYKPWNDFKRNSNINRYLREATSEFYWFYNLFPELTLSKNREQIIGVQCKKSKECRFGTQNNQNIVDTAYIHGNWENSPDVSDKNIVTLPVIDTGFLPVDYLHEGKDFNYIYPVSYPSPGANFYQLAPWNSLRTSGWLQYANDIPNLKAQVYKNILVIGKIIEVADWYWTWKYPDFEEKPELIETRVSDTYQAFNDFMAGNDKAGKNLFLPKKTNPNTFESYPGWEIKSVDNKQFEGIFNQDSAEASSQLLYALGWDPALTGMTPGKQSGGGSGSDKRVAFNIYISKVQAHRDIITEPLYFIRDYNNWDPELEFRLRFPMITSLDKGKEVQQQSS